MYENGEELCVLNRRIIWNWHGKISPQIARGKNCVTTCFLGSCHKVNMKYELKLITCIILDRFLTICVIKQCFGLENVHFMWTMKKVARLTLFVLLCQIFVFHTYFSALCILDFSAKYFNEDSLDDSLQWKGTQLRIYMSWCLTAQQC